MKLNRDLLLGEIAVKFAGSSYSSARVALAYDCIFIAEEWFNNPTGFPITEGASNYRIRRELRRYVKGRINNRKYTGGKYGFIPSILWWWISSAVVNWIVNKILDIYF
tara:strand:- start:447 stop:770 length:324 start_codon:yes stop_codon:yes gene_type:complete